MRPFSVARIDGEYRILDSNDVRVDNDFYFDNIAIATTYCRVLNILATNFGVSFTARDITDIAERICDANKLYGDEE